MNGALTSFSVSLAGMVILLAHKMYEMKRGATIISSSVIEKANSLIEKKIYQRKDEILARAKVNFTQFARSLGKGIHTISFNALHGVHSKTSSMMERMKGRNSKKNTKGSNPVSFFLKNVAEVKQEIIQEVEKIKL